MEEVENPFNKFFGYLLFFAFIMLFWNNFKADMAKRNGTNNLAQNKTKTVQTAQRIVYRKVYVNNNYGGPATVYYVTQ